MLAGMFPSSKHRTRKKIVYLTCKESYLICLLDLVKLGSSCQAGLLRWEAGRQVSIHLDSGNEVNYTGYRIMHKIAATNSHACKFWRQIQIISNLAENESQTLKTKNILFQKNPRPKRTSNLDSRKTLIKDEIWIMVSHLCT